MANQLNAARWILERLLEIPRTPPRKSGHHCWKVDACVGEGLRTVITTERIDVLELLTDHWLDWENLEVEGPKIEDPIEGEIKEDALEHDSFSLALYTGKRESVNVCSPG
jgi:hypothetical protein